MKTSVSQTKILWEVRNGIGLLRLNAPPGNRMDTAFFRELRQLTQATIPQSGVSGLIVSGSGRHFSSGADLDELVKSIRSTGQPKSLLLNNYNCFRFFDGLNIPVIAAIQGVCLGSGLELALHCHFRLCATDALLGLPETGFGLIPGAGGIPQLISFAGKAKAIELIMKGSTFAAKEALELQVADAVFPKNELMENALQLAAIAMGNYRKYRKKEYLEALKKVCKK